MGGCEFMDLELEIVSWESPTTQIIDLESKYAPDVVTTSGRVNYKVDGVSGALFVKAVNVEDAVKEIIPYVCFQELVYENDFTFEDFGLDNPVYDTYDDGSGEVSSLQDFVNLGSCEVHIHDMDSIIMELYDVAVDYYNVDVVYSLS